MHALPMMSYHITFSTALGALWIIVYSFDHFPLIHRFIIWILIPHEHFAHSLVGFLVFTNVDKGKGKVDKVGPSHNSFRLECYLHWSCIQLFGKYLFVFMLCWTTFFCFRTCLLYYLLLSSCDNPM